MKSHLCSFALLATTILNAVGGQTNLGRVFLPVDPLVDAPVTVVEAPFYYGGGTPESPYDAITEPYVLKQGTAAEGGDINLASRAGIKIDCECYEGLGTKLIITWDFSQADSKLITKELIEGLLECLKRTAGKSTTLYSSFVGAEPYPIFKKMIEAKYTPQTDKQKKQDLIQEPAEQVVAPNGR